MEDVKVIALSTEQLQAAYKGLLNMAEHLPVMLAKVNYNGRGVQAGKTCQAVLITAANACFTLYSTMTKGDDTEKAVPDLPAALVIQGTEGIRERLKLAIKFKTEGKVQELERLTAMNYGADVNLLLNEAGRLAVDRDASYMDGVKNTIYEIMKEADVPGSQAIRDSGDSDDGMCAQAAVLLTAARDEALKRADASIQAFNDAKFGGICFICKHRGKPCQDGRVRDCIFELRGPEQGVEVGK